MRIHIVEKGDTLFSIARRYGVSVERLAYDNEINQEIELVVGQALIIRIPVVTYTIRSGDTLSRIAERFDTTVLNLLRNNSYLLWQEFLIPGERIVILYEPSRRYSMKVTGYAYPFIDRLILQESLLYVNELLVFSYGFTEEGELIPPEGNEEYLIRQARIFSVRPILVLTPLTREGTFNSNLVSILVENEEMQAALINNLLNRIQEMNYAGVDVDFEYIPAVDKNNYSAFIENLKAALSPQGYQVSVALAPKTYREQPGILFEGLDFQRIGAAADYIFLMTYEWGYTYGPPMAVAPLPQVRTVVEYAVSEISEDKLLMGVPNYGYDWPLPFERGVTAATTIGNIEAVEIASNNNAEIIWDDAARSPYFNYTRDGIEHVVWFEDVRSIQEKVGLAAEFNLAGIGYWNLMRTFRPNWMLIHALINPQA